MIELNDIIKTYPNGVRALNGVSVKFPNCGLTFILGKSGSGKSTLLNVLGGLDSFTSGEYKLFDKNISNYSAQEWDEIRNYYFGFVFQDYLLLEDMCVYDNIAFSLNLQGKDENQEQKVQDIMQKVGIEELGNRKINELSGGQKQRVVLARALVKNPKIIFADEPTGNLDEATRQSIYKLFKKLSNEYLFIVVSHDKEAAIQYGDRIITIADGEIISDDPNEQNVYEVNVRYQNRIEEFKEIDEFTLDRLYEKSKNEEKITINLLKKKTIKQANSINNPTLPSINIQSKKQSLSAKTIWKFSFAGIKKHKIRVSVIIGMFVLTFFLLFTAVYISFFNMNVAIANYLKEYPQDIYSIYTKTEMTDPFYSTKSIDIETGKYLRREISNVYGANYVMGAKKSNIIKNNKEASINLIYANDTFLSSYANTFLDGYELIITDYTATLIDAVVGNKVYVDGIYYTVKAIVKTDYIEYNLINKLTRESVNSNYASSRLDIKYSIACISEKNISGLKSNADTLNLNCANFFNSNTFSSYFNGTTIYGGITTIDEDNLIWGRMPKDKNEIAIYYEFATYNRVEEIAEYDSIFKTKTFSFKDIASNEYGIFYSRFLNLAEYFPEGVKVVGVYNACNPTKTGEMPFVVINNEIYDTILQNYYDFYYYDAFVVDAINCGGSDAENAALQGLMFKEPIVQDLYQYQELLNKLIIAIYIIMAIILTISVLMIISYIMFSISDNTKKIGIMKALGVYNKDIVKIFIFETVFIAAIAMLLGTSLHCLSLILFNYCFKSVLVENAFNILYFNGISLLIVNMFALIIFFSASFFPIFKVAHKKPMDAIRKNN